MEIAVMGFALAFNIVIILWKLRNRRKLDGILDLMLLAVVMWLTVGTLTGMLVGTIASFVVSTYLLIYPVGVKKEKRKWHIYHVINVAKQLTHKALGTHQLK